MSPGLDPRVVRYHDGDDWTPFVSHLGLRGPGPIEESPLAEETADAPAAPAESADPEIAALPRPGRLIWDIDWDAPGGARAGWYRDPEESFLNLKTARYYDGEHWSEFVCEVGLRGPGEITRKPVKKKRNLR